MYDFDWKQERIDGVLREIAEMRPEEIAALILTERFHRKAKEYEVNWLDRLADVLREGDSFNEMQLYRELMANPKQELVERYKNQ